MKIKIFFFNSVFILSLYLFADILFSNFYFKQNVDHKCYEHDVDGKFYKMRKNCFANMRLISSIDPFKVYTDKDGFRYSGKKKPIKDKNIVFLGDSQTFGVGSDWDETFIGILEKKYEDYNFKNLAVPSYSPTVYKYSLEEYLKKNDNVEKVFVLIDITDVADEANRWSTINDLPKLAEEKIIIKEQSFFTKFKKNNFKGLYLISSKLRSFTRKMRSNLKDDRIEYKPVEGNPTGAYLYTNHDKLTGCNSKDKNLFWECGGVKKGISKIINKTLEISQITRRYNSEFYIIIIPWPDTLNYGQTVFNWENFAKDLCNKSNCNGMINLFPKFKEIKKKNNNWLNYIYLKNDIHLTKNGNALVAQEIEISSF